MDFFKQYSSGLRLVATQQDNCFTVSFGVYVNVGSAMETAQTNGYSHFIEHLLFKGTKRRTAMQISEEMDDIGANLNAFTSKDSTCFYTKCVSSDLEKCVDVLSDIFFFAQFPEEELQREKGVVLEEINMCEDTPDDVSADLVSRALFFNHPLGQSILGNAENIKHSDRHSIQNFKNSHYLPHKTVISVAGKVDFELLDKLVERYFESNFSQVATDDCQQLLVEYTSKFLHKFKKTEQCHMELAFGGVALSSPNRYAFSMMSGILGGGMSSRLFQSIREKQGLAYSVFCMPSYYSSCGMLEIYCGLNHSNIAKVCNLLQQEVSNMMQSGVTEQELARAKAQAVNGLYMNLESNMTLMRLYGRCMLKTGKVYCASQEIENFRNVSVQQVNALAQQIFSQKFASSYVGRDVKNFDKISQLKF